MVVLAILLSVFTLLHGPPLARLSLFRSRRDKAAAAMAAMFFFTGTDHFANPGRYLPMMPPYVPIPLVMIYVSGFFELLGAAGLLVKQTRRWAAYGLVALLLGVFQANVYVALKGSSIEGLPDNPLYYWVRLPLQFVFIGWALWCSKVEE
ncbi:MAG TPA: MauE/DoxX family redox-associated membrane protein [Candidatus Acidoferrales bacterium]